ncbi:ATP phosphoribosyltransferase regulatory subunit [Citrobacter freundii complex sp. 2023EL-00966]|uniref:Eco57I restriction-modification methylase domain-containing protein n=1 Tax=Citrobacter freundii complex sp. 2023EL-00966 TaxID=3076118 RepID=UPI002894E375|nr:type IIL restriction-modification enzyme MmeI [Citrobacter freundii complex sp. 2023EL-00966]MDT3754061.1 ATP phosphoribosyltransferase regulatory subunit [Citrobacter freundii complex sp. 2023EL-00966]
MSMASIHDDWLSLIDISGPFLAVPVLKDAFPQGLEELDAAKRKRLRQAYDEWREALEQEDPQFNKLHFAWIEEVLSRGLEFDEDGKGDVLKGTDWCAANLNTFLPDHGVALSPNLAIVDEQCANKPLMLIQTYAQDIDLDATLKIDGWAATPTERMVQLCRSKECRLGLVTNGERWMLVDAPVGAVTSFASWYARLWNQEPSTLQAFVHLLGIRRFFVDESEQLPALFDSSLKYQDEVTDALGEQVRRAVEVLIQSLDKADQDRNRELLYNVKESELYEAALTVMMRLVFLLSAEERGLLLLGDERYEANYALSTLRMQLRKVPEEILERRWDAWSRLLAIFRAVFCGVEHESLRLPALGSSLFDPDHFPFLEGRAKGSSWRTDMAKPLPIDNRTVLLLLEAIQQFQGRTLSYRALDVEQIGYVYEGLLERTVRRTDEVTLELDATKKSQYPWVKLVELDSASMNSTEKLVELLKERSGSSVSRVRKDLAKDVDDSLADRLLTTCQGDIQLRDRIKPYAHLLRTDPWGYPLVYPAGAFIVTSGSNRRETGTHYTPKSLTENIVTETLTPIAYIGPAEGAPRKAWQLKSPTELLDLKICDPAMGSGAFLVQACRWLADRLVEAWSQAEATGKMISVDGDVLEDLDTKERLPRDTDARIVIARRLIAEQCLYGVDLNPLAVELAKLSIWLVTLAKGLPFGFLDHSLRCGDSLLGIHRLDQLTKLCMTPEQKGKRSDRLFGKDIERSVRQAIELRQRLRAMPIRDIHDVEIMASLDARSRGHLEVHKLIADAFITEVLVSGGNSPTLENALSSLSILADQAVGGSIEATQSIANRISNSFTSDLTLGHARRPFHWPLEFPEVFLRERSGFDAFVGNPPFLGNRLWKSSMGDKLQWQCQMILGTPPGKIDLSVVFHRRVVDLLRADGCYGLLAASNIAEGSAVAIGLGMIVKNGDIYFSRKGMPWPGTASVVVSIVVFFKGRWGGSCDSEGKMCQRIGARLEPEAIDAWVPKELSESIVSFQGVDNSKGMAFVITEKSLWFPQLKNEPNSLLRPYITGDDITTYALRRTDRWALDIADRKLEDIEQNWPIAFQFLIQEVQPTRTPQTLKSYKGLYDRWWQFWNHRAGLMRKLREKQHFIGFAKATKYPFCMTAPSEWLYTNQVLLIDESRVDLFTICLSSFFRNWLYGFSVRSLGADTNTLRLSIREAVATFALPNEMVSSVGCNYATEFQNILIAWSDQNNCGLTETMNAVNTPSCNDPAIIELRQIMVGIDIEVAQAYGWNDLDISYDYQEFNSGSVRDPWRWALSEDLTTELMRRLTELNRQRFEEFSLTQKNAANPVKRGRRSKADATVNLLDLSDGAN